jgi:transposase-like protein
VCSYEDRIRAVQLYLKLGKRIKATIRQLVYPTKNSLKAWHRENEQCQDLLDPEPCVSDHTCGERRCLSQVDARTKTRGSEAAKALSTDVAQRCTTSFINFWQTSSLVSFLSSPHFAETRRDDDGVFCKRKEVSRQSSASLSAEMRSPLRDRT